MKWRPWKSQLKTKMVILRLPYDPLRTLGLEEGTLFSRKTINDVFQKWKDDRSRTCKSSRILFANLWIQLSKVPNYISWIMELNGTKPESNTNSIWYGFQTRSVLLVPWLQPSLRRVPLHAPNEGWVKVTIAKTWLRPGGEAQQGRVTCWEKRSRNHS